MGSLIREEGYIYSLATSGNLLYTGSDSKNIRVWKNLREFSAFKSSSGLVKTIVIYDKKIYTGHQDGKIRIWKMSSRIPTIHRRVGTLPTLRDIFKTSMRPSNYVETKKNKTALWIKHFDAVSCLCMGKDKKTLYSASWDKTIKVWRLSDSKCMESINAHDDVVNSIVCGSHGMVFSGSADGTVKAWRRDEQQGRHVAAGTLLEQECSVTSLAVDPTGRVVYGGSSDGIINWWKRKDDDVYGRGREMRGHERGVLCMAAEGMVVVSGSADKTIRVWRREGEEHTCVAVLTGHEGPVKCLAVKEDREAVARGEERWLVYSGSLDKSVKVWSVLGISLEMGQQSIEFDSIPSDAGSSFSSSNNNKR